MTKTTLVLHVRTALRYFYHLIFSSGSLGHRFSQRQPASNLSGRPEDDSSRARRLCILTGSPEIVAQFPVWRQREFTEQTRGHAQSQRGEAAHNGGRTFCWHLYVTCVFVSPQRRQLIRDGFVVDPSEGERALRHLFLYTDLLLCTKFKQAGKG